jgi:general secretion pathway protein D
MRSKIIFLFIFFHALAACCGLKAEDLSRLVPLPKMSEVELSELVDTLNLQLTLEHGYRTVVEAASKETFPQGLTHRSVLEKENQRLFFAIKVFLSRPPMFWVHGMIESNDATKRNPDVDVVEQMIADSIQSIQTMREGLRQEDLSYEIVQLSYIDIKGSLEALKGFGFNALNSVGEITWPLAFDQLPLVAPMPTPSSEQTALVGGTKVQENKSNFNVSVSPQMSTEIPNNANSARSDQLLVYYHAAHPDQWGRLRDVLKHHIDQPAIQIFVEGLVLEISEEGLKDLGIDWAFQEGKFNVAGGDLAPGVNAAETLGFTFDSAQDLAKEWQARVRALIEDGKAEILSRPSVLTLNNRQATIRVGTDIPIATSQEGVADNSNKIAFQFNYLPTGISLNVRPRVAESKREVSMMVDTIVSSPIPGADLELKARTGEILAAAPTVATRRVQTYARIENNTPFIIGGLVTRDQVTQRRRVPLLSSIPYLGKLFRSSRVTSSKREVIIVLTPHVLADRLSEEALGRFLPKDEDRFDQFSNALFRDAYRIRAEDVFDLSFLEQNEALGEWRSRVRRWAVENPTLTLRYPFNQFIDERIAGEDVLVHRMIYEVLKRLSGQEADWMDQRVGLGRIIYFAGQRDGGYDVKFLSDALELDLSGDGQALNGWFESHPKQALVFQYVDTDSVSVTSTLNESAIPQIQVIECPDEDSWGKILWEYNQPDDQGRPRSAIVLHHPDDLERLRRAVLLKEVIGLNGGTSQINLNKFRYGKVLLIPDPNPQETHLIDREVATYFFHSEHYYAAALNQLDRAMADLEKASAQLQFNEED